MLDHCLASLSEQCTILHKSSKNVFCVPWVPIFVHSLCVCSIASQACVTCEAIPTQANRITQSKIVVQSGLNWQNECIFHLLVPGCLQMISPLFWIWHCSRGQYSQVNNVRGGWVGGGTSLGVTVYRVVSQGSYIGISFVSRPIRKWAWVRGYIGMC